VAEGVIQQSPLEGDAAKDALDSSALFVSCGCGSDSGGDGAGLGKLADSLERSRV
jgi:hypothetical protein